MDQTTHTDTPVLADAQAAQTPDDGKSAKLDLVQVSKPEPAREKHEPHSMGQFLSGLDHGPGPGPAQIAAQFTRRENFAVPLHHKYLDNNVEIKSLESKNPSYTATTAADGTRTLSNFKGLSLNLEVFGHKENLAVKGITISKDATGLSSFKMDVENPLPPQTQKVFNAPATLPLTFLMNENGKVSLPQDSELFTSLAAQSGGTLPGMILHDGMADAASVAQFIEHNPVWVNTIMAPFMTRYAKDLKVDAVPNAPGTPQPADPIHKNIGKIVQANTTGAPAHPSPFAGFTGKIQASGDYHETMQIDGRDRTFTVHVPPGYNPNKQTPMVIIAHGLSQTGEGIEQMIGANHVSDKNGFIAIYPDSVNWFDVKDLRTWDTGNGLVLPGQHSGDIHFMDNIIATAKAQLNVDPQRVYMIGHSNGGMLTYTTAAALSGELAGIGILNSAMSGHEAQPKEPLSMYNTHGTADEIIPYEGLTDTPPVLRDVGVPVFQPAQFGADYYKKLDGITAPYAETKVGNQTIQTAENPANGTAVMNVTVAGEHHVYQDMQGALEQAWDFLKNHPRTTPVNTKDDVVVEPDVPVEKLTTVQQLLADVHKRGTIGIEEDADNTFDAARSIKDGSINPSALYDSISKSAHAPFNDPVNAFFANTTSISKKQDHIEIDRKTAATVPLDASIGIGQLKTMEIGNVSFDLAKANGYPELKNISGIVLHAQVAGYDLKSKIKDITELPDGPNGSNGRIYRATMQNPLPSWMKKVLLSPSEFNVDLKLDQTLTPTVINTAKTQRQLLGKNPWVNGLADEAQDVANVVNHWNAGNTALVASDVGLTAGATYLAYRLALRFGGTKAKIAGGLAFLAAPMAIDFIRREFES